MINIKLKQKKEEGQQTIFICMNRICQCIWSVERLKNRHIDALAFRVQMKSLFFNFTLNILFLYARNEFFSPIVALNLTTNKNQLQNYGGGNLFLHAIIAVIAFT